MKTAVFIHKTEQIARLSELLATIEGEYDVIACGADIEFLLEEKNILYRSAHPMLTLHPYERLRMAREFSERIMDTKSLAFFSHKGISIAQLLTPSLFYHLTLFLYYFDIATSALEEPYDTVVCYGSPEEGAFVGILDKFNARVFEDGLRQICNKRGIIFMVIPPNQEARTVHELIFALKRVLFGCAIYVLNFLIRISMRRKKIRILASEYWKNISPLMSELPEGELLLLDRSESLKIGLRAIIRHRMQFVHSDDFVTRKMRGCACTRSQYFANEWTRVRDTHVNAQELSFKGYPLAPMIETMFGHSLRASEKIVRDIEGTFAMLEHLQPDVVMVRASISSQIHFAILCEVARILGIPSLEAQHGIFSVGPETETSNRAAEYIADYGPIEQKVWREHGYAARSRFIDIGSPRFDPYIAKNVTREAGGDGTFKILHIAPTWFPGSWNDSWDVLEYFQTMASAVRGISNVHIIIKLREGRAGESFYREVIRRTFNGIPHSIAQFESLADLLPLVDVIVSCHSTALLEALMAHRPVILDASLPVFTQLARNDFKLQRAAGVFLVAETSAALKDDLMRLYKDVGARKVLSDRAKVFMKENYLFNDGKSSRRLAEAIRELAHLKETR